MQRAMGLIRSRANQYNINGSRVGVIGFSAGAMLPPLLVTTCGPSGRDRAYAPIDEADDQRCTPDFALLLYPYFLGCGKGMKAADKPRESAFAAQGTSRWLYTGVARTLRLPLCPMGGDHLNPAVQPPIGPAPPMFVGAERSDTPAVISAQLYVSALYTAAGASTSAAVLTPRWVLQIWNSSGAHGKGIGCFMNSRSRRRGIPERGISMCKEWPIRAEEFLSSRGFLPR